MNLSTELTERCGQKCELCQTESPLDTYIVSPKVGLSVDEQIAICEVCKSQIDNPETINADHWRCLNESIWSPIAAVQVVSYRMLQLLDSNAWVQDLLSMIYMDEATQEWADAGTGNTVHKDSNGHVLEAGDTVVLIKDLDVKGAGFIAKRGTAVRRISLVQDNPDQIEGKVNDQQLVILTKFVKKA